jgi:ribonuclease III family protein
MMGMVRQRCVTVHNNATLLFVATTAVAILLLSLFDTVDSSFLRLSYYPRFVRDEPIPMVLYQQQYPLRKRWIRTIHGSSSTSNEDLNDAMSTSPSNHVSLEMSPDVLFVPDPYDILRPSRNCRVELMSPTDLAYIGDVVYELFVRCRHVWPSKRTSDLQDIVVHTVRAENQAKLYHLIRNAQPTSSDDPLYNVDTSFNLTTYEQQVLTRGRNANNIKRKQHKNPVAYQEATGFEALLGYMYITNATRCKEFLVWIDKYGR